MCLHTSSSVLLISVGMNVHSGRWRQQDSPSLSPTPARTLSAKSLIHFKAPEGGPAVADDSKRAVALPPHTANPASFNVGSGIDGIGTVVEQVILTTAIPSAPETNLIIVQLPKGQSYRAGDYLAVLPKNPQPTVDRALQYFHNSGFDTLMFNQPTSFFPTKVALRLGEVLALFVELGQPVSKVVLPTMAKYADDAAKAHLKQLESNHSQQVIAHHVSLLDILFTTPGIKLPLNIFLGSLPRMKICPYSISSTPLEQPNTITLTFSVHTAPSAAGDLLLGVAPTTSPSSARATSSCAPSRSRPTSTFPPIPGSPLSSFAAGAGLAPFFGFIAECALTKAAGRQTGEDHTLLRGACAGGYFPQGRAREMG